MNSSLSLRLLLVDDDPLIADSLRLALPKHWQLTHVNAPDKVPREGRFHAAFVDQHLTPPSPHQTGIAQGPAIIEALRRDFPRAEIVAISGDLSMDLMESCLDKGAQKFLAKPLLLDEVRATIEKIEALWLMREIEHRPQENQAQWIGPSAASESLRQQVARLRGERGPILIEGETGTGKEVVARLLHQQDPGRPFVTVNVGALPENLFESEFFGHVKGAFTGADSQKVGLSEAAAGGDLFLDEIEALPLSQQPKLLRFLESGEIRRVGAKESSLVKTRVIAATNQGLEKLVREGKFREDLLFRLRSHQLKLVPLRERPDDIEALAKYFLSQERPRSNKIFTPEAFEALRSYNWPGNVRELKRVCEQVTLTSPLPMIRAADVERLLALGEASTSERESGTPDWSLGLSGLTAQFERQCIEKALRQFPQVELAAERLQISRSTLYKKMKDLGIEGGA